jgi:hypothetical protein
MKVARTPEDIIKTTIGNIIFENAVLQSKLEDAQEKVVELEKAVAVISKKKNRGG